MREYITLKQSKRVTKLTMGDLSSAVGGLSVRGSTIKAEERETEHFSNTECKTGALCVQQTAITAQTHMPSLRFPPC